MLESGRKRTTGKASKTYVSRSIAVCLQMCAKDNVFKTKKNAETNTGSPRYSMVLVFDYSRTRKQRRTSNNKEKLIFSLLIDVFDFNFKKKVTPANYKRTDT